jgi:hypothetical protein
MHKLCSYIMYEILFVCQNSYMVVMQNFEVRTYKFQTQYTESVLR